MKEILEDWKVGFNVLSITTEKSFLKEDIEK